MAAQPIKAGDILFHVPDKLIISTKYVTELEHLQVLKKIDDNFKNTFFLSAQIALEMKDPESKLRNYLDTWPS